MTVLAERTPLHIPALHYFEHDGISYAVDGDAPNWIAVESSGAGILRTIGANERAASPITFGALVAQYAAQSQLEAGKAWVHIHDFLTALDRARLLADTPFVRTPYLGRAAYVQPQGLRELWLQINNACNLTCTHCLVSSGPGGIPGMSGDDIVRLLDDSAALGVERLYVTGGEPFLRKDIFDLINRATKTHGMEVILLTNATLFAGRIKEQLDGLDRGLTRFQVSIDGANAATDDGGTHGETDDRRPSGAAEERS